MADDQLTRIFNLGMDEIVSSFGESVDTASVAIPLRANMTKDFESTRRILTDSASYCITRFVASEVDFQTAGKRGMGRMSEHVPRLAAKHRRRFRKAERQQIVAVQQAITDHMVGGYLWFELSRGLQGHGDVQISRDALFNKWVPGIYLPPFNVNLDDPDAEYLATHWFAATARRIHDAVVDIGVKWDFRDRIGSDQAIVTHYFTGGQVLRGLESL